MQADLRDLLAAWPYDPDHAANNVRRLPGDDGRLILQIREPLGIQQMEYEGRPDGFRPGGAATWLELYQARARAESGFKLDEEACRNLMQEGVLFYQRYLILFQTGDWEGVVRDTSRNLRYFDFLRRHAPSPRDVAMVEQYRPYVLRMSAVAKSRLYWEAGRHDAAIESLRRARRTIEGLEPVESQVFELESKRSVKHLEELIAEYERDRPENEMDRLRREQREAVLREDFESAARLRDEIRRLEGAYASPN